MNEIGRGCLGAIGGFAAAVALTVVWGIFLLIAAYSFAFALGSHETLRTGGVVFFVALATTLLIHVSATILLLRLLGTSWPASVASAIVGNILAAAITAGTIAVLLTIIGDLPQTVLNTVTLMLVLSIGCPVALSLAIGRAVAWPGLVTISLITVLLGGTVLLFRTLYVPLLIVLVAWTAIPAYGGLLGRGSPAVPYAPSRTMSA